MNEFDTINDKRTLERYSKEWYVWLLSVMEKRKLDFIWVKFTPRKFGGFKKDDVIYTLEKYYNYGG